MIKAPELLVRVHVIDPRSMGRSSITPRDEKPWDDIQSR
jgi:hypothetical protein